jgi:hypothetical protein
MIESIATVLMRRDGMSREEADSLVEECRVDLLERVDAGEMPYYICEEYFGLEPDYLDELTPL